MRKLKGQGDARIERTWQPWRTKGREEALETMVQQVKLDQGAREIALRALKVGLLLHRILLDRAVRIATTKEERRNEETVIITSTLIVPGVEVRADDLLEAMEGMRGETLFEQILHFIRTGEGEEELFVGPDDELGPLQVHFDPAFDIAGMWDDIGEDQGRG